MRWKKAARRRPATGHQRVPHGFALWWIAPIASATGYVFTRLTDLPPPTTRAGARDTTSARTSAPKPRLEGRPRRRSEPDRHRPIRRSPNLYAGARLPMKKLLITLFAFCSAVMAQTDAGSIRVFVVDSTDSRIGDAAVRRTNAGTGVSLPRTTDADGYATFLGLCAAATSLKWRRAASRRRT